MTVRELVKTQLELYCQTYDLETVLGILLELCTDYHDLYKITNDPANQRRAAELSVGIAALQTAIETMKACHS